MSFNAKEVKDKCVEWIREWFKENGNQCKAVIGISGGVDSSVVAALCVEALGKERVYGVLMPQNSQDDIDYSYELCEHLGIKHCVIDIGNTVEDMLTLMYIKSGIKVSNQTEINIPARVRMVMLYAISQSIDGRVANTCNLSENYVGYSTKYGDAAGDFSPLESLTKTEVKAIGKELGLPERLVVKVPTDGLCGKTDEENLGFSYDVLDKYIRTGEIEERPTKHWIDALHMMNDFKMKPMAHFEYTGE
jgi:NAD+ synthase